MKKQCVISNRIVLVLALFFVSLASVELRAEGGAKAKNSGGGNTSGLCQEDGQVLIYRATVKVDGRPQMESRLAYCESRGASGGAVEPRALSRREVSDLYSRSQKELGTSSEHADFWRSKLGITFDQLTRKTEDDKIGREEMQFPGGRDRAAVERAAGWLSASKAKSGKVTVLDDKQSSKLELGWLNSFQAACERSGGVFSIPIEELSLVPIESLGGQVLCKCRGKEFSNPIDYKCNGSEKPEGSGGRRFIEFAPSVQPSTPGSMAPSATEL